MKSKLTFAIAASMLTLALAAAPQNADAAVNAYLNLSGIKGEAAESQKTTTAAATSTISYVFSLVSLILLP